MEQDKKPNTIGLVNSSKQRNDDTYEKVERAIVYFKRNKDKKVTVAGVAMKAEVAVATIYNNKPLHERILQLKALRSNTEGSPQRETPEQIKRRETKDRVKRLMGKVSVLEIDKADCVAQIAALTTENLSLKGRLKELQRPVIDLKDRRNKS